MCFAGTSKSGGGAIGKKQKILRSCGFSTAPSESNRQCGTGRFWFTLSISCRIAAYLNVWPLIMESRSLKLGVLSLFAAWSIFILVSVAGYLRWDNRLLWVPPALMALSFILAASSWDYEERRAPLVTIALAAFASIMLYSVGYVFLFLYSIPNHGA